MTTPNSQWFNKESLLLPHTVSLLLGFLGHLLCFILTGGLRVTDYSLFGILLVIIDRVKENSWTYKCTCRELTLQHFHTNYDPELEMYLPCPKPQRAQNSGLTVVDYYWGGGRGGSWSVSSQPSRELPRYNLSRRQGETKEVGYSNLAGLISTRIYIRSLSWEVARWVDFLTHLPET